MGSAVPRALTAQSGTSGKRCSSSARVTRNAQWVSVRGTVRSIAMTATRQCGGVVEHGREAAGDDRWGLAS